MLASMWLVRAFGVAGVAGVVVGQDLVQPAPGLLEQPLGRLDLLGRARVRYLHDARRAASVNRPGGCQSSC